MRVDHAALLEAFAIEVLDSFEKLEVVVALAEVGVLVTLDELQAAIGLERDHLAAAIEPLVDAGVIARFGDRLAIARHGLWNRHCDAAVKLHAADRRRVLAIMSAAALQRVRLKTARAFADAFVLGSKAGKPDR